jgi:cell division protease FtsH
MGGRVAEELIFGYDKVSSGASSDISYATDLARSMATQWGMSDKLGPLKYVENQEEVFLGHSVTRAQNMSEETARLIDSEVRAIVTKGYERARQVLTDHIDQLHAIAGALLEYETLTGDEIKKVMEGGTIDRGGTTTTPVARPAAGASAIPKAGRRSSGPQAGIGEAPAGA